MRGKSEFTILDMKKDGVRFRNSKMAKESEKYINLQKEYETTQATLVEKIMEIVRTFLPFYSRTLITFYYNFTFFSFQFLGSELHLALRRS